MKRFAMLALLSMWLALPVFAQTAKVMALSDEDGAKAKQLHEAADEAKNAVEKFDQSMRQKYTSTKENEYPESAAGMVGFDHSKRGWEGGFEYSEDWKFIVPKSSFAAVWPSTGTFIVPSNCPIGTSTTPAWSYLYSSPATLGCTNGTGICAIN